MEDQVQFIQYQLWALIGLFLALVLTNVVCYLTRGATSSQDDDRFREMWEKPIGHPLRLPPAGPLGTFSKRS
jgi:hypothetical protein